jgi:hypothetical protein
MLVVAAVLASCTPDDGAPTPSTGDAVLEEVEESATYEPDPDNVIQIDLGDEGRIEAEEEIYLFTDRGNVRQCDVWNDATGEYEREPCTRQDTVPELSPEEVDNGPLEDRMLEPVDE